MRRKQGPILVMLAGLLAFVIVALGFIGAKAMAVHHPPGVQFACGDVGVKPTFLAYDAATAGQNFGPSSTATNVALVEADLHLRRCTDPALTVAHAAYYGVDGLSLPISQLQFQAAVQDELQHPTVVWRNRVRAIEAFEASGSLTLSISTANYQTLYFQKGSSAWVIPQLASSTMINMPATVFVIRHGSVVKELKLNCGYQPHDIFPNGVITPPPVAPPAVSPPVTPVVPARHSCPPQWPYGTWPICKDGPSHDPLVNPNVPDQVKGPGTGVTGPATPPVDSPCGFATCPKAPPPTAPPSGPGPVTLPPPTTPPVTIPGISHDPPVTTPISPPPPPSA